ncbi:serine/threonine-protein kinase D6PKL2-like [Impatiens glandulifera]|uniref:serine/threonine-protein kinase D6PKL2-like n=1 Tax=Impatiens glandulifera TaxID=253017 RepID=UPI001FB08CAC|nr:serine/threonine-protein kinase D6PKL2-like [Impatiens glandulifera]
MEPWLDDLPDDLQSMSFNSTTTDTEINTSISSASETASSSAISFFSRTRVISCDDPRWCAIKQIRSDSTSGQLSLSDLRFLQRLGSGDIGAVYLAVVKSSSSAVAVDEADVPLFAAKVMDKKELTNRNKEGRARTEREILEMLEHPFLPTLYAALESPNWSCLLTEFCPGGDLHVLRQRQPCRRFHEFAARFYASEVVVALEYVHMMGIIYRDLKPENVLVRSDGHIMLTDFDLSLKCNDSSPSTPQITDPTRTKQYPSEPTSHFTSKSCIIPNCIVPAVSCFNPKRRRNKNKNNTQQRFNPEFITEPLNARSMSFVGTHEYLAPEIVSGEGHGAGVDWWTLGIFIFELLYGTTPFRGPDNEMTLANIVARALEFPKETTVPAAAKDLVTQLLVKDPAKRLGSVMGALEIKQHPFFQGVNWALLRCTTPPIVPVAYRRSDVGSEESCPPSPVEYY